MTLLQSGRVSTPTLGATCLHSLLREVVVAGVALLTSKITLCSTPPPLIYKHSKGRWMFCTEETV